MRFIAAITFLLAVANLVSAVTINEDEYFIQFSKFMVAHNKTYEKSQLSNKYEVFKTNYDRIVNHNLAGKSWTLAVNQFADLTWDEFRATKLGYKPVTVEGIPSVTVDLSGKVTVPSSINWVDKGAVTGVKNQGNCGGCWSFSATGSVEGAHFLKTGSLVSLSEQQLIDCSGSYGNDGCDGGLEYNGFQYIIDKKGLCSESSYPFTAKDGSCHSCTAAATLTSFVHVAKNNEDALQAAIAQQPVSVGIEADQDGFQFYSSGVFDGKCGTNLDHSVLAVGYGSDSGKDYWLVKNSWGASWGASGYIKMVRKGGSTSGQCGIAMDASYPIA